MGFVVIGRNEGDRLARAIRSLPGSLSWAVYVDSASTDGSAERARSAGIPVEILDASAGLSAGKGRNAGFSHLRLKHPDMRFVQFLDGDSELEEGWASEGRELLERSPRVGVVCGIVSERDRDRSMYRRLMDMEWRREPGQVTSCGGIFMVRTEAFEAAGRFDPTMPYGEEAEMCARLREKGWTVMRTTDAMAVHDSGIDGFSPWWRRCVRGGRAYALGVQRYARADGGGNARRLVSCLAWGLVWPLLLASSSALCLTLDRRFLLGTIVLLALPIVAGLRIALRVRARFGARDSWLYATFCMIGKLPECWGAFMQLLGRRHAARRAMGA